MYAVEAVFGGYGDDVIDLTGARSNSSDSPLINIQIHGDAGRDELVGNQFVMSNLNGGIGADRLTAGNRSDILDGGSGPSEIDSGTVFSGQARATGLESIFWGNVARLHYVVVNRYDAATDSFNITNTNGERLTWTRSDFEYRWNWHNDFTGASGELAQAGVEALGMDERTMFF